MSNTEPMSGRWHHEASEKQLKRAISRPQSELDYAEVRILNHMYIRSLTDLIIVRTGMMGGETLDIHGGWVYLNDISLRADWEEILKLTRLGRNAES